MRGTLRLREQLEQRPGGGNMSEHSKYRGRQFIPLHSRQHGAQGSLCMRCIMVGKHCPEKWATWSYCKLQVQGQQRVKGIWNSGRRAPGSTRLHLTDLSLPTPGPHTTASRFGKISDLVIFLLGLTLSFRANSKWQLSAGKRLCLCGRTLYYDTLFSSDVPALLPCFSRY